MWLDMPLAFARGKLAGHVMEWGISNKSPPVPGSHSLLHVFGERKLIEQLSSFILKESTTVVSL